MDFERTGRPIVRPICQVSIDLTDARAYEAAIRETVSWLASRRRSHGRVPSAAFEGEPFDLSDQPAANPTAAVVFVRDGRRVWAAKQQFPDADVPQRTWITEISIAEGANIVHFGARLTNVTRGTDEPFTPSVPGVVRQIASVLSAEADGFPITDEITRIDGDQVGLFLDLMVSKERRLPIVAFSVDEDGCTLFDPSLAKHRLHGAAHIVEVMPEASWEITRALGKWWSIYNGAVRLYWPGLQPGWDEPHSHPFQLFRHGEDGDEIAGDLAELILPRAFSRPAVMWRFEEVRARAAEASRSNVGDPTNELAFQERALALETELSAVLEQRAEDQAAQEELLSEAERFRAEAVSDRDELMSENDRLRSKIATLLGKARSNSAKRLTGYDVFEVWADQNLGDSIEIQSKALRELEKDGTPEMLERIEKTFLLIRDHYIPMRRQGGIERLERFREECRKLGVEEEPCFSQKNDIKNFPEYRTTYRGRRVWMDHHFKYGNSGDLRESFCIYFHFDEDDKVVVVGHMPSHLDNWLTRRR